MSRERRQPVTTGFILKTHQVWLRGSHVSLPTFSMQNFWGPLLPGGWRIPRKQLKCTRVTRSVHHFVRLWRLRMSSWKSEKRLERLKTHPWAQRSRPAEACRCLSRTASNADAPRYPPPSRTAHKHTVTARSEHHSDVIRFKGLKRAFQFSLSLNTEETTETQMASWQIKTGLCDIAKKY